MFGQAMHRLPCPGEHIPPERDWIVAVVKVTHPSGVPGVDSGELVFHKQTGIFAMNIPGPVGVHRSVPQRWAAERFLETIPTMSVEEMEEWAKNFGLDLLPTKTKRLGRAEVAKLQQDLSEAERRIQGGEGSVNP